MVNMGYWVQVDGGRIFCSTLKDAYRDAAKTLLGAYRISGGAIHTIIPGYTSSKGVPIYDSAKGKACNHWVRFSNGSNPKDGYEEVSYGKSYGIAYKSKNFPRSW